jgi:uncharacterized protein YecE (DUF72 family)
MITSHYPPFDFYVFQVGNFVKEGFGRRAGRLEAVLFQFPYSFGYKDRN